MRTLLGLVGLVGLLAAIAIGQRGRDQRREGDLIVGSKAPNFKLKLLKSKDMFELSSNFGKRPTVLIFGSYT